MPGGIDNVTIPEGLPELLLPMAPPNVLKRGISSGYDLTQANVEDALKADKVVNNPKIKKPKAGVDNWTGGIEEAFATAAAATWNLLQWLPVIGDTIEVISGKEDGDLNDLGTAINKMMQGIQDGWNLLVNGLDGWDVWDADSDTAAQAVLDNAATVASLAAAVTDLQNNRNNAAVGGRAVVVDFTTRPDSTTLGADFDQNYSGSGTGYLGIENGVGARWFPVNNASRTCVFRYNLLESATDYQKVWVAFGSSPASAFGNNARNEIHGRKNAAGDTYVYAAMEKGKAELGCVIGGAKTTFVTNLSLDKSFSFKSTGLYALECGTVGVLGVRVFRLLDSKGSVILPYTEVGTTSQLGADYRGAGGAVYAVATGMGTTSPGRMIAWALADNQPPTRVGSGIKVYRANEDGHDINTGANRLQLLFWDNVAESTAEYQFIPATGSIKVLRDGWYHIEWRQKLASLISRFQPRLYKNDAEWEYFGDEVAWQSSLGGSALTPRCFHAQTIVPLEANDEIRCGYDFATSSTIGGFIGEPTGFETFLKVTKANWSLA